MRKIIGTLAIIVLVLSLIGAVHSYFTAPAIVNTTVNTASVSVEWLVDNVGNLQIDGFEVPPEVSVSGSRGSNVYEAIITVEKFYPGAEGIVGLALNNIGSLPVRIQSMRLDVINDPGGLNKTLYFGIPGVNVYSPGIWATEWDNVVYIKDNLNGWNGYTLDYASAGVPQIVFNAGQWYAVYAYLGMDPTAGNEYQDQSIVFTITSTVEQAV